MMNANDFAKTKSVGLVYLATNLCNGKVYVGITTRNLKQRIAEHKSDGMAQKSQKSYFHKAIQKYGFENFKFEIIDTATADTSEMMTENLKALERHYIDVYGSHDKYRGYNLTTGGDGVFGMVLSDAHKAAVSKAHKGKPLSDEHKKKIRDYMRSPRNHRLGSNLSDEAKERISRANKGRLAGSNNPMYGASRPDLSERNRKNGKKVAQVDLVTGETIRVWNSLCEISRETGFNRKCITDCCNHITKRSHGFRWEYIVSSNIETAKEQKED